MNFPRREPPRQSRNSTELLTSLFSEWNKLGVPYAVLRNHAELPQEMGNDLDVLVDADSLGVAERLLAATAKAHGYALVNRAEFSPVSLFTAHHETRRQLHFDLFTSLKWRGFDILRAETVLAARRAKGQFFISQPVHEASLNLLTRLLYHGYVKETYKSGIVAAYAAEPEAARRALEEPFGEVAAQRLVARVLAEDWAALEAETGRWRRRLVTRQLRHYPLRTLLSMLSDTLRLLRRFALPPGLMVVLVGPDGSGKSSVAEVLRDVLAPTFYKEKGKHLHWKPSLVRAGRGSTGPVTNPHGKPPRSRLTSLAYFAFHWLEFALGAQLRLRPLLFRNGFVVVDRYYYDFFVDPKRYRLDVSASLLAAAYPFVMKPDLVFCLDAPPEVLQGRKQEVTLEETARQRRAYLDMVRALPNGHVVDASRSLAEVVTAVEGVVLDYLTERAALRSRMAQT